MRWRERADEYGADPTTTEYTVLVQEDVPCHLALLSEESRRAGEDRAELIGQRRLLWDPAYQIAEGSQLEVSGARWNTVRGTFAAVTDLSGTVRYRRCDVVAAE